MATPLRFDELALWPEAPGQRLNSSIMADGDTYIIAVRGSWRESDVLIGRLDSHFCPLDESPNRLSLNHRDATAGREDPRLFRYKGRPHVAFTGLVGSNPYFKQSQLFARLSSDATRVEEVFSPQYNARQTSEKNWGFFDYDGDLYAIYSFVPCNILRIDKNAATIAHSTPTASLWNGGPIRGGAAPILVGEELWCFTHDRISDQGHFVYRTGLVTLDCDPPFRVRRMLTAPLLTADRGIKPIRQYASVVFPGGAVRLGDRWIVAHGVHDRWSELHSFSHADLESRLVPLP